MAIKDKLKEKGGKYNPHLTDPRDSVRKAGWIFSKNNRADVEALLQLKPHSSSSSSSSSSSTSLPATHATDLSIPEQLKQMHALMKDGCISEAEFAQFKQKLLK
jgi:hypothetical protein